MNTIKLPVNTDTAKNIDKHMADLMSQCFNIEVEVLENGRVPTKAHASDAGFDLFATDDITLHPGEVIKHPLNVKLKLPRGTWAEITTKSGLGSKGQLVYAGVIDQEYRGVIHVIMTNLNLVERDDNGHLLERQEPLLIKKGQKVAQLIMNPYSDQYYMTQVTHIDTDTARGSGGFGSTGA
jgi:dUTP pyrophosphatase